ncbi:MAG: hypothetical protein Q9214_001710 [Letrouitia sp. 1 TL-2023]
METAQSFSTALGAGQSDEKLALLNDIDRLRSYGISRYVQLPQLIVCGDQSSGKSSVLEAISGIPFPIKDNLCTRFATEVILRHAPTESLSVAIVPDTIRSEEERSRLLEFRHTLSQLDDFSSLVDEAKDYMGVTIGNNNAFSTDVLRLEISGPDQPHLTIVDLPGLIHSSNQSQSDEDVKLVKKMVQDYMSNGRSIILAVVSAKNDYANQIILKLARKIDKYGTRTIGIITKPDMLHSGSESEASFVSLARNMDIEFRLGWHVLRNRDYSERQSSMNARNQAEKQFFEQGVWKDFPRDDVGVSTLREKLSDVLFSQIKAELPALIDDIEKQAQDCQATLINLGSSRDTVDQQRLFLLQISQEFQAIAKAAVDGSYGDEFFGDPRSKEGSAKRLRAVIQNQNIRFAEKVRLHGQNRRIIEDRIEYAESLGEKSVSRSTFIDGIQDLLSNMRGRELPGMYPPLIVGDLFREQSKPWEGLARSHVKAAWDAAKLFIDMLLSHLADETTADRVLHQMVYPSMDKMRHILDEKISEIFKPYKKGHPITYNHYFTETVQKVKEKRRKEQTIQQLHGHLSRKYGSSDNIQVEQLDVDDMVSALTTRTEADMDRYACMEILDSMEAYYKVAMKTMVDNVATQAIEWCLITNLEKVFTPVHVQQMDAELVSGVASESAHHRSLRETTDRKLVALQSGLEICKTHASRKALEISTPPTPDGPTPKLESSDTDQEASVSSEIDGVFEDNGDGREFAFESGWEEKSRFPDSSPASMVEEGPKADLPGPPQLFQQFSSSPSFKDSKKWKNKGKIGW